MAMEMTHLEHSTVAFGSAEAMQWMDPTLWVNPPEDLIQLVFARLPVTGITRLRCLSKEWKRNIDTVDSKSRQMCAEASASSMFALISREVIETLSSEELHENHFWVRTFDVSTIRWHGSDYTFPPGRYCLTVASCEGGLVCFLSKKFARDTTQLFLIVVNLLTNDVIELPSPDHWSAFTPTLVQLCVDHRRKRCKVIVVNKVCLRSGGSNRADLYDSEIRQWTVAERSTEILLGHSYSWMYTSDVVEEVQHYVDNMQTSACMYDFAEERMSPLILDKTILEETCGKELRWRATCF